MGRLRERLDDLDSRVLRYEHLTPREGSPAEAVWAELSPEQQREAQRAAYNGLAVDDPRQAFVCAELMRPQLRKVKERRVWLAAALGVCFVLWIAVFVTGAGGVVSALTTAAVTVVFARLLLDVKFERLHSNNVQLGRSVRPEPETDVP